MALWALLPEKKKCAFWSILQIFRISEISRISRSFRFCGLFGIFRKMKSAPKITLIFVGAIMAESCIEPENTPDGMIVFCEEDLCSTFCDNDLMSPVNGKDEFNCSDYTNVPLPFPTHCELHRCTPPLVQDNVVQSCTDLVLHFNLYF